MAISDSVRQHMAGSSWIRRMFEAGIVLRRERGLENVFDLSLGNPVAEPPEELLQELRRLVTNPPVGGHRYMPNAGYSETRQAVAAALAEETGLPYTAAQIIMTVGAGGAINVALHSILNPGDEVLILTPYFPEYLFYTANHQGTPVVVRCDDAFNPDLADLASKLTPQTKAVLLNMPNNPSGAVYSEELLDELASILHEWGGKHGIEIYQISDEPYRKLLFDDAAYPFPQLRYPLTITATSHSKDLAVPGERIGYLAIHPECPDWTDLIDACIFSNRVLGFVNAPALMQQAIARLQHVTVDVKDYQRKRDFMVDALTELGYRVRKPQGAFYLFPRSPVPDELVLTEYLQRHGVLVVPGRGFGLPGHFRISFCVEDRVLEGALEGFRSVAKELGIT